MKPRFTLTLEDQCSMTFKTKKGNHMLFLFLQRHPADLNKDRYEMLDLMTNKRHIIDCEQFNKQIDAGYFFDFARTKEYVKHQYDLVKETNLGVVVHVEI